MTTPDAGVPREARVDRLRALLAAHPAEAAPTAGERDQISDRTYIVWDKAAPSADAASTDASEGLSEALHRAFHDHWSPGQSLSLYADSPLWRAQAAAVERIIAAREATARAEGAAEALREVPRCAWHSGSYPDTCWWCNLNRAARSRRGRPVMSAEQPSEVEVDEREAFCWELGPHLADAMESMGIEDADLSDGRVLADVVYCLGYRITALAPDAAGGAS